MSDELVKLGIRVGRIEEKVDTLQDSFNNHFTELKESNGLTRNQRVAVYMGLIGATVKIIEVLGPLILG